jgi:hypothetical protein
MAINFPVSTAFAVVQVDGVFIFISFQGTFDFLSYFCYHPLIIEQCVIQAPIICVFSAVVFVVEF